MTSDWKIAYITAGAGGMYCGSCMHDNTLARALRQRGIDAQLIPTYTPIRTDEEDHSVDRIFFGGINVFLQQKIPFFRYLPRFLDRWLDNRWLIRKVTAKASSTSAKELGALTVSMLKGTSGFQRKEVKSLCEWLNSEMKPDLINLSNMLIAGCLPHLKEHCNTPIVATLQGDDIFLEDLPEPYKSKSFELIYDLVKHVDRFITNSDYYADFMSDYFKIPRDRFRVVPLAIDTADFSGESPAVIDRAPTVGYLARLAPEKGFHVLADSFLELRKLPGMENAQLRVAGWLGENNRSFAEEQFDKLKSGAGNNFEYVGSIDRADKIKFLNTIDVLSVPTTYREPKGLFVLEAMAAGVPVVQPSHGAFPEMIESLGGGELVVPNSPSDLAQSLAQLLQDAERRVSLGLAGQQAVLKHHNADSLAEHTIEVYRELL